MKAERLGEAFKAMGADGCSSDESDEDGTSRIYRRKSWRSQELNHLFHAIKSSGYCPQLRPSPHQIICESERLPPCDIPLNFFDKRWMAASEKSAKGVSTME
jgi:hypothetical protein